MIGAILLAKQMNQAMGTNVFTAWNVEDVPESWIDVVMALGGRLKSLRAGVEHTEAVKDRLRKAYKERNQYA